MGKYGYIRVSSKEQNDDRRVIALSGEDIPEENIFTDKQSGKDFKRPAYRKLVRKMKNTFYAKAQKFEKVG